MGRFHKCVFLKVAIEPKDPKKCHPKKKESTIDIPKFSERFKVCNEAPERDPQTGGWGGDRAHRRRRVPRRLLHDHGGPLHGRRELLSAGLSRMRVPPPRPLICFTTPPSGGGFRLDWVQPARSTAPPLLGRSKNISHSAPKKGAQKNPARACPSARLRPREVWTGSGAASRLASCLLAEPPPPGRAGSPFS